MPSLKIALRSLARRRSNSAITVIVLALGIGLTTATFSILDGVLLRPLDLPVGDRLVSIVSDDGFWTMHGADYHRLAERQTSFDAVAGYQTFFTLVSPEGSASRGLTGSYVTANFFDLLQVRPSLGRAFVVDDERPDAEQVALISSRVWKRDLGSDPQVLGRSLLVNGLETAVVGVLPEGAHFPYRHDIWLSMRTDMATDTRAPLAVVATLRKGVTRDAADRELAALATEPAPFPAFGGKDERSWRTEHYATSVTPEAHQRSLSLLMLVVVAVLLIASSNVASLRIASALQRQSEIEIRRSLGATPARVVSLLTFETVLLVGLGCLAGLAIAVLVLRTFESQVLPSIGLSAYWIDTRLDLRSFGMAVLAAAVAALLGGLGPALLSALPSATRTSTETAERSRWRRSLVVIQVSLATALLVGCGLMIRSVDVLRDVDPGMAPRGLLTGLVQLHHLDRGDPVNEQGAPERREFERRLIQALTERTEISSVALGSAIPGESRSRPGVIATTLAERDLETPHRAAVAIVSPGYFETLSIPIVAGRAPADGNDSAEIVVNASFARKHLSGVEPLGARVAVRNEDHWLESTVVGVAADVLTSARDRDQPAVYLTLDSLPGLAGSLYVIAPSDTGTDLEPLLRDEVARADLRVSLHEVRPLSQVVEQQTWNERLLRDALASFGAVAALLAAVGLFGLIASNVATRTRELGLRLALGALPRDLRRLVLRQGLDLVALGLVVGFGLTALIARPLSSFLYGVSAFEPTVFVTVAAVFLGVGVASAWLPAQRAASAQPSAALRYD